MGKYCWLSYPPAPSFTNIMSAMVIPLNVSRDLRRFFLPPSSFLSSSPFFLTYEQKNTHVFA